MAKKNNTPYDLLEWKAEDLKDFADDVEQIKKNLKKGKFDIKELSQLKRWLLSSSSTIKYCLEQLEDQRLQYDKLYKRQPKNNKLNRDLN